MQRIAIIGGGAAGLGAAWTLHKSDLDFVLYEAHSELGGHATTVDVPTEEGLTPVDMGVILTAPAVYPNLYAMLAELDVKTQGVAVDFGASFGPAKSFITGRPRHGQLWARVAEEAARFECAMLDVLDLPAGSPELMMPLGRVAAGYSSDFVHGVLLPLMSLFVVARTGLLQMPVAFAASYLRQVSLFSPTPWRIVQGGTRAYLRKLAARFGSRLRLAHPVACVEVCEAGVRVHDRHGAAELFDHVVLAVDAPDALALLRAPSENLAAVLSAFEYEEADVYLHSDVRVLSPHLPAALLSQYVCEDAPGADLTGQMTYNLGVALGLSSPVLVTVMAPGKPGPDPACVVSSRRFRHARVTGRALLSQRSLATLQGNGGLWFCGAYASAPTHEAALASGIAVACRLGAKLPYPTRLGAQRSLKQHAGLILPTGSTDAAPNSASPRPSKNPFLNWNFAPWRQENDYSALAVQGQIPPSIVGGSLLRVGPNPAFDPIDARRYTWFDGDGMVNEVQFAANTARFRNRYVKTLRYRLESAADRVLFGTISSAVRETTPAGWRALGLTESDVQDLLARVERKIGPTEDQYHHLFPILTGANTSIAQIGSRLLALEEAGPPYRIDPKTLATLGEDRLGGALAGPLSAHPITDPRTRETYALGYFPFPPYVRLYVIDASGDVVVTLPIDLPRPVMMHSFALSARHVVLFDFPTTYLAEDIGSTCALRWRPEHGARLGVLSRADAANGQASVKWFAVPLCWVFHVLNAFDEHRTLVLDVCRYERVPFVDAKFGEVAPASLERWRLDLETGRLSTEHIAASAEFPTLDERFRCGPHRYGYVVAQTGGALLSNTITRVDFAAQRLDSFTARQGMYVGEALFVPRTADSPEGDGHLLSMAYDALENRSEVLILDAMALGQGPVATVPLPRRVPFEFHGLFLPGRGSRGE